MPAAASGPEPPGDSLEETGARVDFSTNEISGGRGLRLDGEADMGAIELLTGTLDEAGPSGVFLGQNILTMRCRR